MKPLAAIVLTLATLLALAALLGGRPAAADEWTEYPGPELPEYNTAPTPPPPSGLPELRIYGGTRTSAAGIEVIVVLTNPDLLPLPAWNDPVISWIDIENGQERGTKAVNLFDAPYWLERADIPGCATDRYCQVRITAHALVPTGTGQYDLISSNNVLTVLLPPVP